MKYLKTGSGGHLDFSEEDDFVVTLCVYMCNVDLLDANANTETERKVVVQSCEIRLNFSFLLSLMSLNKVCRLYEFSHVICLSAGFKGTVPV